MGTLGKDLFDIRRPRRNTRVEFGESCYWVESNPAPQPYGTILTEILNLDTAPYQAVMDRLDDIVKNKNSREAPRAYLDMLSVSAELPLYRLYATDYQMLKDIPVEMLVVGEAREAFEEHVIEQNPIRRSLSKSNWTISGSFRNATHGSLTQCSRESALKRKRAREKNLWRSKYICTTSARL